MLERQLQLALTEGESYFVEFKAAMAKLDREIVAFANASGGWLYLGVDDSGQIVGCSVTNSLKSKIQDIAYNCDPSLKVELFSLAKGQVLAIHVAEGLDKPYRCKDGFFLRNGPSCQKLKRDDILKLVLNSPRVYYDEALNTTFNYPADFSEKAFQHFLSLANIQVQASVENILISLNCVEQSENTLFFKNAAVLLFAEKPQKFFPEAYITCVRYRSSDRFDILDKKDFTGNVIEQIESSLAFIGRHMSTAMLVQAGSAQRQEVNEYPLVACREAIVNAVVHRDYFYDVSHIYVHMYNDRIEIENPGGVIAGLKVEDILKRSVRRNRLLADLLHRAKYIERVGSGFDRMTRALAENQNPPFELNVSNFFLLRFYPRVLKRAIDTLTARQTSLYQLVVENQALSKNQAAQFLGVSEDTALRDLRVLMAQGLIRRTGIGKAVQYVLAN